MEYLTLRRWLSVCLLTTFGVSICISFAPLLDRAAESLGDYLAQFRLGALFVFGLILAISVGYKLGECGALRIGHYSARTIARFPSAWLACLLGSGLYIVIRKSGVIYSVGDFGAVSSGFIGVCFGLWIVALFLGVTLCRWFSRENVVLRRLDCKKSSKVDSLGRLDEEGSKLIAWIENEGPIETPEQDKYDRAPIARRIARLLREDGFQTVGITGEFGSGKSSIVALVRQQLREEEKGQGIASSRDLIPKFKNLLECHVNTWGFSRENIAQHILSEMVNSLSDHVDTLSLQAVPNQYVSALNDVGGNWFDSLINLASSPRDPLTALRDVDEVLDCVNYRLVVFIEDIDRNSSEELVKVELFALLDRLKAMRNISFVVAIGNDSGVMKYLMRVLEHIEPIESLKRHESRERILEFRKIAKESVAEDCIYIYSESDARSRMGLSTADEQLFDRAGLNERAAISHMAALLDTPRVQKLAFRRAWSAWLSLRGEVDFDELLTINILRHSVPQAYVYVNENIDALRRAHNESNVNEAIGDGLQELVDGLGWRGVHAKELVIFLFPAAFKAIAKSSSVRPQRVAELGVVDYWTRISREELQEDDSPRDQEVLRGINEWRRNHHGVVFDDKVIADALIDVPRFAEQVEMLGVDLQAAEVLSMASQLFERLLGRRIEPEQGSGFRQNYPGFIQLCRMYNARVQGIDVKWIVAELESALHKDFRFSNEIYYFWRPDSVDAEKVYRNYVGMAKSLYSNNIELFVDVLPRNFPFSLYHFFVHFSDIEQKGPGIGELKWAWLGKILVQAVEISPDLIVPQLVVLLTDEDRDAALVRHYKFKCERAEALWGKHFKSKLKPLIVTRLTLDTAPEIAGRLRVISEALA